MRLLLSAHPDGMVVGYFAPLQLEHAVHYAEVAAKSTAYRVRAMSEQVRATEHAR